MAYIAGAGVFADYADIRTHVQQQYMIDLPEHIPAWFIVLPALIWIAAGATHKEVTRQRVGPRIFFDAPRIIRLVPLSNASGGHDLIDIVNIAVRNNPISRLGGVEAKDAYGIVEFYCIDEVFWTCKMRHPRWTENLKPRPDDVPVGTVPKFRPEMNFRTLPPNNSPSTLDFAIKHLDEDIVYGFEGSSQGSPGWKNVALCLFGGKWIVNIKIDATNLETPAEYKFVLKSHGPNKRLEIIPYSVYEVQSWVGE